jgi:hypothetical protein
MPFRAKGNHKSRCRKLGEFKQKESKFREILGAESLA